MERWGDRYSLNEVVWVTQYIYIYIYIYIGVFVDYHVCHNVVSELHTDGDLILFQLRQLDVSTHFDGLSLEPI